MSSHIQDSGEKREHTGMAVMVIGMSVPRSTTNSYWLLQRRLLAHAERCSWWMGELDGDDCGMEEALMAVVHMLGPLYADQGRLAEAEAMAMYQRAPSGFQASLRPSHPNSELVLRNIHSLQHAKGTVFLSNYTSRRCG
jgi:hypothetical protein